MNPQILVAILIAISLIASAFIVASWTKGFKKRNRLIIACNIAEGTHEGSLTKFTDAALASRHLLVKFGSDVDHVAVNGAGDMPLGTVADDPDAAEALVSVDLLAVTGSTRRCVCSEAIALTDELYTAANGKVQNLPAGAGTYYKIGRPLQAGAADGAVIEFEPCYPVKVTVA